MEKLHFSIVINAPKQKVWETLINDATYREWTAPFNSTGSYFEGEWTTGSEMRFLGPNEDGTVSGMLSKIIEARPYDFISIQHMGEIIKGEDKIWTEEELKGTIPLENYTLNEVEGNTEVLIDLDVNEEWKSMMENTWPKALDKLKEIAEK